MRNNENSIVNAQRAIGAINNVHSYVIIISDSVFNVSSRTITNKYRGCGEIQYFYYKLVFSGFVYLFFIDSYHVFSLLSS